MSSPRYILYGALLATALLAGCDVSNRPTAPTGAPAVMTSQPAPASATAYPAPESYPAPEAPAETAYPAPTSTP
jgi:hypothetical protein